MAPDDPQHPLPAAGPGGPEGCPRRPWTLHGWGSLCALVWACWPLVGRDLVPFGAGVQGLGEGRALVGLRAFHTAAHRVPRVGLARPSTQLLGGKERHVGAQTEPLQGLHGKRHLRGSPGSARADPARTLPEPQPSRQPASTHLSLGQPRQPCFPFAFRLQLLQAFPEAGRSGDPALPSRSARERSPAGLGRRVLCVAPEADRTRGRAGDSGENTFSSRGLPQRGLELPTNLVPETESVQLSLGKGGRECSDGRGDRARLRRASHSPRTYRPERGEAGLERCGHLSKVTQRAGDSGTSFEYPIWWTSENEGARCVNKQL